MIINARVFYKVGGFTFGYDKNFSISGSFSLQYTEREGYRVSRAEFEKNLLAKIKVATFGKDVGPFC